MGVRDDKDSRQVGAGRRKRRNLQRLVRAVGHPQLRNESPTMAWRLRQLWTAEMQGWARRGLRRISMHDGTTRDVMRIVAAMLGLLDHMNVDGALGGRTTFWSLDQLQDFMHMSRPVAMHTLTWLLRRGALAVRPHHSSDGREVYEPWLVLPEAQVNISGSEVDLGPSQETLGAQVKVPSSRVYQFVEPRGRRDAEEAIRRHAEDSRSQGQGVAVVKPSG